MGSTQRRVQVKLLSSLLEHESVIVCVSVSFFLVLFYLRRYIQIRLSGFICTCHPPHQNSMHHAMLYPSKQILSVSDSHSMQIHFSINEAEAQVAMARMYVL
jgi:hypothetical protein